MLLNKKFLIMLALGFASGLPIALTASTLQAWLAVHQISITTIGWFGLIGQPYALKFLWAPLLDSCKLPWLTRWRSWLMLTQLAIVISLLVFAYAQWLKASLWGIAGLAFLIALLSATQDIAFDAYRTTSCNASERGLASSFSVFGYRIAMLISGGLAICLGAIIGWSTTYALMALVMLLLMIVTWLAEEFSSDNNSLNINSSFYQVFSNGWREFTNRQQAVWIIIFIISYKLGDAFALSLNSAFLINGVHFSPQEVGLFSKTIGFGATVLGMFIGGGLLSRISLYQSLMIFGILQNITNLFFWWLNLVGHNYYALAITMFVEQLSGGMGTIALISLLMFLCHPKYTASQFALLSALAALGRIYVSPLAGNLVNHLGWGNFFLLATAIGFPSLLVLNYLKPSLVERDSADSIVKQYT